MNTGVSWLALVMSVVALILAWTAFNRTGTDVAAVVEAQVEQATRSMRADLDRVEDELRTGTSRTLEEAAEEVRPDDEEATTTP